MKIVVAPDSFKSSISATEICNIAEKVAKNIFENCEVTKLPIADGGEGTVDCLVDALNATRVYCDVCDPLGRPITAGYAKFGDSAVMEMAQASGISLVKKEDIDILRHSTFGTGQMMLHAVKNGAKKIYIGIGGSATNDGGMGFASALGIKFLDENNAEIEPIAKNFMQIKSIDLSGIDKDILNTQIVVMCDVTNPLLGEKGATAVFGKQKGADEITSPILESGLEHYITVVEKTISKEIRNVAGAGAAGGLGSALKAFVNAKMQSGVSTILDILNFEEEIADANLVITGEGMMDYQSAFGKVASGVGGCCKAKNVPCVAIVGSMGERAEEMYNYGITSIIPTVNGIMSLDYAMKNADELVECAIRRALRLFKAGFEMQMK